VSDPLREALERKVAGSLRSCIDAHGPITPNEIGSAAKRIAGLLAASPAPLLEEWRLVGVDHDCEHPDEISPVFDSRAELDEWRDVHDQHEFYTPYDARVVQKREVVKPGPWVDVPAEEQGA
jgi:hypothetical protein